MDRRCSAVGREVRAITSLVEDFIPSVSDPLPRSVAVGGSGGVHDDGKQMVRCLDFGSSKGAKGHQELMDEAPI